MYTEHSFTLDNDKVYYYDRIEGVLSLDRLMGIFVMSNHSIGAASLYFSYVLFYEQQVNLFSYHENPTFVTKCITPNNTMEKLI